MANSGPNSNGSQVSTSLDKFHLASIYFFYVTLVLYYLRRNGNMVFILVLYYLKTVMIISRGLTESTLFSVQ